MTNLEDVCEEEYENSKTAVLTMLMMSLGTDIPMGSQYVK
jgi:hypothetical protein